MTDARALMSGSKGSDIALDVRAVRGSNRGPQCHPGVMCTNATALFTNAGVSTPFDGTNRYSSPATRHVYNEIVMVFSTL